MTSKIEGYKPSQPIVGAAAKIAKAAAVGNSGGSSAETNKADQLTLTSSARSLQKISDAVASVPVVNSGKVESIKLSVADGTYKIDSQSIAKKLLKFESNLK